MKKNRINLIAALATAVFSLSSCIYDDEVATFAPNSGLSQDEVSIAAVMQGVDASTRAAYNLQTDNLQDWRKVGIFVYKTGKTAAVTASTGVTGYAGYENIGVTAPTTGTTAPTSSAPITLTPASKLYFPVDNSDVDVYVYAPYSADYSPSTSPAFTPDVKNMEFTVEADQTEDDDYIASDFIYGMAMADYDAAAPNTKKANVTMYHALTKMTFKLEDGTVTSSLGTNAAGITKIALKNVFTKAKIDMNAAIVASPASGESYLNNATAGNTNVTTFNNSSTALTATRSDVTVAEYDPSASATTHTTNFYAAAKANGVSAIIPPHSAADLQDSGSGTPTPVQVEVTIDGVTKTANIYHVTTPTAAATDVTELLPGFEYVFNLKIKGSELILVVVSVVPWVQHNSGDRDLEF